MIIDGENEGNLGRKPMWYRGADYAKDAFQGSCTLPLTSLFRCQISLDWNCRNVVRSAPFPQNHSFVKLHSSAMGIRKCPDWQLDFLSREWCKWNKQKNVQCLSMLSFIKFIFIIPSNALGDIKMPLGTALHRRLQYIAAKLKFCHDSPTKTRDMPNKRVVIFFDL